MKKDIHEELSRRNFFAKGAGATASALFLPLSSMGIDPRLSFAYSGSAALQVEEAVAAIKTAKDLYDLFKGDPGKQDRKMVYKIFQQNAEIIRLLKNILEILVNLGITIQKAVHDEFVLDMNADVDAAFQTLYKAWLAELDAPNSPHVARDARFRYNLAYPTISHLGQKLALYHLYGFAPFHTVGIAMLADLWLTKKLKVSSAMRKQDALKYIKYFGTVLDEKIVGSIAYQIASTNAQISRLDIILNEAETYQPRSLNSGRQEIERLPVRRVRTAVVVWYIGGNRNDGYTVERQLINEIIYYDGPHKPLSKALSKKLAVLPTSEPDPPDNPDSSPWGLVKYWNSVRKVFLGAQKDLKSLEAARTAAIVFRDAAIEVERNR